MNFLCIVFPVNDFAKININQKIYENYNFLLEKGQYFEKNLVFVIVLKT